VKEDNLWLDLPTDEHPAAETDGALIVSRMIGDRITGRRRDCRILSVAAASVVAEQRAASLQIPGSEAVGKESEVADAHEAAWDDVHEEPAQELVGLQRHNALPVPVGIVLPAERHVVIVHADQPMVGDGDFVRISREVLENVCRPAEGRLGVDNPVITHRRIRQGFKRSRIGQAAQPALRPRTAQQIDELPSEHTREHTYR